MNNYDRWHDDWVEKQQSPYSLQDDYENEDEYEIDTEDEEDWDEEIEGEFLELETEREK